MPPAWPELPYAQWHATRDTLHGHTQVLGKLAAALAPPEPQLQHAALRLTARGWETAPLPAPDGSGAFVVGARPARACSARRAQRRPPRMRPARTRPVGRSGHARRPRRGARRRRAVRARPDAPGDALERRRSTRIPSTRRYDAGRVATFHAAATRAAQVLAALRAPFRGRSTPVNAWWGSFDLAVSLFSGQARCAARPPTSSRATRWTRRRSPSAGGRVTPAIRRRRSTPTPTRLPRTSRRRSSRPPPRAGTPRLGEFVLDWDDIRGDPGSARRRALLRPLRRAARLCRVRLGRSARGQRRGRSAAAALSALRRS